MHIYSIIKSCLHVGRGDCLIWIWGFAAVLNLEERAWKCSCISPGGVTVQSPFIRAEYSPTF